MQGLSGLDLEEYHPRVTPWRVNEDDFPREGELADKLPFLVRYAALAPSFYNTQPWSFSIAGSTVSLFADPGRWPSVADADRSLLHLYLGGALENLLIAAEHFAFQATTSYFPQPGSSDLVATVDLHPGGEPSSTRPYVLFDMIPSPLAPAPRPARAQVPEAVLSALRSVAHDERVQVRLVTQEGLAEGLVVPAEMLVRATYRSFDHRRELARWLGSGTLGDRWLMARLRQLLALAGAGARDEARRQRALLSGTSAMGIVAAPVDEPEAMVRTGQVIERLRLAAGAHGFGLWVLDRLVAAGSVADLVSVVTAQGVLMPLAIFALASGVPEKKHLPRRRLEEVLSSPEGRAPGASELDDLRYVM